MEILVNKCVRGYLSFLNQIKEVYFPDIKISLTWDNILDKNSMSKKPEQVLHKRL